MVEKNKDLVRKARPGETSIRGSITKPDVTGPDPAHQPHRELKKIGEGPLAPRPRRPFSDD